MSLRFPVTLCVTFTVWTLVSIVSQAIGHASTLNASHWLTTGATFAALLVAQPGGRLAVILGAALAAATHTLFGGHAHPHAAALPAALFFGLVQIGAAAIGATLAGRLGRPDAGGVVAPGHAYLGLLLGAFVTALLDASFNEAAGAGGTPATWWLWISTSFAGIVLVAPVALALFAPGRPVRLGARARMLRTACGALAFALFLAVTSYLFDGRLSEQLSASVMLSLTYLPLLLLVGTAVFWSERASALATLAGALAFAGWTHLGAGPFAAVEGYDGQMVSDVHAYVIVMALLVGVVNTLGKIARLSRERAEEWRTRYLQVLQWNPPVASGVELAANAAAWQGDALRFAQADKPKSREERDLEHQLFRFGA